MRTQRFFSPTTMPATDWRASRYSHDPPSRYLVSRAFRTEARADVSRGFRSRRSLTWWPMIVDDDGRDPVGETQIPIATGPHLV